MKCKTCGHELKESKTFEIEGFIVTKPVKCTRFNDIQGITPRGFRLPTRWELFKIFEKMENRKKLSDGEFMFFWSSLIENDYSKGLFLYRSLGLYSDSENLADSLGIGRVVFIKEGEK